MTKEYRISVRKYADSKEIDCKKEYDFSSKADAIKRAHQMCKDLHEFKENVSTYYLVYSWNTITHDSIEEYAGSLEGTDRRWVKDTNIIGKYLYK